MAGLNPTDCQIFLGSVVVGDADDWSGVSDATRRKKIQNRINQRSRRARQRNKQLSPNPSSTKAGPCNAATGFPALIGACLSGQIDLKRLVDNLNALRPRARDNEVIIRVFEAIATHDRSAGLLRSNLLSSLSQFNFTRALMLNADVFGFTADHMHDDACSLFVVDGPWPAGVNLHADKLPPDLRPTQLQRHREHHPWIDLLPIATLRENIIKRDLDSYDEDGLCHAFTGRGYGQGSGVIVWREPWDASGWEVTAEFARSWGWVIAGCSSLFQSTNMWRAKRGERPLFRSQ